MPPPGQQRAGHVQGATGTVPFKNIVLFNKERCPDKYSTGFLMTLHPDFIPLI